MTPAGLRTGFENLPIRRKLMLIAFVTSVMVMGTTTAIFYVTDILSFQRQEMEHRRILAEIICKGTREAIARNDRIHAADTLGDLAGDRHVLSAWIVLKSGEIFASYLRSPELGRLRTFDAGGRMMLDPGELRGDSWPFAGAHGRVKTAFTCEGEGDAGCTTIIVSDTSELRSRMAGYLVLSLLVIWGVASLGYLVTCRLQRIITDPLASLVSSMERVRATRDYSIRVQSARSDEIGTLADCFNRMLQDMEAHREQLGAYQEKLMDLIAIRTEELLRVKERHEIYGLDRKLPNKGAVPPVGSVGGASLGGEATGTIIVSTDVTGQEDATASSNALYGRLFEDEDRLRKSLAAELHDEIGRDLAALGIYSQSIRAGLPEEVRSSLDDKLSCIQDLIFGMSCKVANIVGELRPPLLDDFGLVKSLEFLTATVSKRHGIEVDLVVSDGFQCEAGTEMAIYRIVQEALDNAATHSGATSVMVLIEESGDEVRLVVSDNGCGFSPGERHGTSERPSWGLTIMHERARSCGGAFSVESAPGIGTEITVRLRRGACR